MRAQCCKHFSNLFLCPICRWQNWGREAGLLPKSAPSWPRCVAGSRTWVLTHNLLIASSLKEATQVLEKEGKPDPGVGWAVAPSSSSCVRVILFRQQRTGDGQTTGVTPITFQDKTDPDSTERHRYLGNKLGDTRTCYKSLMIQAKEKVLLK